MHANKYWKYILKNCAFTGFFVTLLFLLSWWYGQSGFEERVDPVGAAHKERNAAIKERNDAQHAWGEMGTKLERAMETNLELRDEFSKAFKDLPWLEKRNAELIEETSSQYNEIERLKHFEQKHDELLQQVHMYGLSAKRPEWYQQRSENVQRQLEVSNNLLRKSEKCVKALKETLQTQGEKADKEKEWLRAKLKKIARSTAYWAKHRSNDTTLEPRPAWGIRCACTEPEIAYELKDQSPRIVELEATVAARDLTIKRLRATRPVENVRKNGAVSMSNVAKTSLPSTEDSKSVSIAGSQRATTTPVHICEHEEQCKILGRQVTDDAKTMRQLRKECQDLRNAAAKNITAASPEINAKTKAEGGLAAEDKMMKDLREELVAKNETIDDLQKGKMAMSSELATSSQVIKTLEEEKLSTGEELAAKNEEINELRGEKTGADINATTEISNLRQQPSDCHKELVDVREVHAKCERELGQRTTRVEELETAQRGLEDTLKQKDREIDDLEEANQELIEQPTPESTGNPSRLTTAETNLDELRHEHAECKGQSETQTARISDLEAAADEFRATIKMRDDRIVDLEDQLKNAPSNGLIERQNQSYNEALSNKDRDYHALYELYQEMLGQRELAGAKFNEQVQSLNAMQQSATRLWSECNNFRVRHTNCDGQIADLANQLRQSANTHTDLQTIYNTQATELELANQNVRELRSEIASLQQANANLEQTNSSSESTFEKYRVEGEARARPIWQANVDREMSAQTLKLEAAERKAFKLENQLQQARKQANPLREMQIQAREDAVKAKEDALKLETDEMDHDQWGPKADPEIKALEGRLAAANKDADNARHRNRGIQHQLNQERKERTDEKERHEKQLKKEREDSERRGEILKIRLEKENPLKGTVSKLQDEVARLSKELEERRARGNDG